MRLQLIFNDDFSLGMNTTLINKRVESDIHASREKNETAKLSAHTPTLTMNHLENFLLY